MKQWKDFWKQGKATAFPSKISVTCSPVEWKAGLPSLEPPHAKTYSTLHSSWAHQRVQPDISMQRSLFSKPITYTDVKWQKFQSGVGKIMHSWKSSEGCQQSCAAPGGLAAFPLLRVLPGHTGQQVPRCLEGFLQWTTHRTSDTVTTPSWKTTPQVKSGQSSHWGVTHFWKVTRLVQERCKGRVRVRSRGAWHKWGQVSPACPLMLLSSEYKSCHPFFTLSLVSFLISLKFST